MSYELFELFVTEVYFNNKSNLLFYDIVVVLFVGNKNVNLQHKIGKSFIINLK